MFELEINEKPDLEITKMKCDKILSKNLDKYELTKYINKHSTNLLIGKPGSGKTSLLTSLFKSKECLKKVFHNIFLFQPLASSKSIASNPFLKLADDKKFDELNYENLEYVFETIKNEDDKYNNCIIIDDQTSYLKNKDTLKLFKNLIFNRRHLRTSIFFLSQTFFSVPKELRRVFSNLFIFKTSKEELENIAKELFEIKKDLIDDLRDFVYEERFNFLFVNIDTQTYYKNWDKISNI
jgi:hypothetical protein